MTQSLNLSDTSNTSHCMPVFGGSYKLNFNTQCSVNESVQSSESVPIIRSYISRKDADHFVKITEITISGQTIKLEDEYKFEEETTDPSGNEEVNSLAGDAIRQEPVEERPIKANKHKSTKIIVRMFERWLKEESLISTELVDVQKIFRELQRRNITTPKLINKIVECKQVSPIFTSFLENKAGQLVAESKTKDKDSALKTIQHLSKLFEKSKNKPASSLMLL